MCSVNIDLINQLKRDDRGRRGSAGGPVPRLGACRIQRSLGFLGVEYSGDLNKVT